MQIGIPRVVIKYLLLRPVPALVAKARPLLDRTPLYDCRNNSQGPTCGGCVASNHACHYMNAGPWTGCNRVWASTFHVMLGSLDGDAARVDTAFAMAQSAITVVPPTAEGGIQHDGSFHQHGPQLYSGWGYGAIFSTNVLVLESYAAGTRWAMGAAHWETFAHLVLDGQAASTRGPNFDFLACGRLFTYFDQADAFGVDQGHYHYFAAFSPFELAFPTFAPPFTTPIGVFFAPLLGSVDTDRPRAPEFVEFDARLRGAAPDSSSHTHFFDSDYSVHHRESYAVFVHMLSSRSMYVDV